MSELFGHILVVDDELAVRLTVREILRRAGHDVVAVASGEEALEIVQSKSFDLALVDLVMPGMGGIELMRRLLEFAPDLKLIVLTARGSMETEVEANLQSIALIFAAVESSRTGQAVKVQEFLAAVRREEGMDG